MLLAAMPAVVSASGLDGLRGAGEGPARPPVEVGDARLDTSADAATLSFGVSGPAKATAFVLADPDRVIIDLPEVDFALDPSIGKLGTEQAHHLRRGGSRGLGARELASKGLVVKGVAGKGAAGPGLVASFRFGLLVPGRSRIVVDLDRPARIVTAGVKTVAGASRLVLELAKTDRAAFAAAARTPTLAAVTTPEAPLPAIAPGKPTLVIDPGHGGPDTGAMVNGVVEKDVTLAFASMLAAKLEATGKFNVVMSRSSDVFVALSERVRIARSANAALMISIHADTLPETADVSGATVYTVSDKASDAYAAKVAAKENEADADVGIDGQGDKADVNDILFDLTRQETRAYSHVFSRTLVNYWKIAGHLNKNPQRAAGFVVLKAPDVPSVLVELGYLSNPADAGALTSDAWRGKATGCMADAIIAYFADQHGTQKAAAGVPIPAAGMTQAHAD